MRKKFWLALASLWTVFIIVLCLVSFNDLPTVSVSNFDKFVHAAFYFTFTVLWYLYLRIDDRKVSNAQLLFKIVAVAVVFGILIEFAQGALTKTRQADAKDALANFTGALLAAFWLFAYRRWIRVAK